MSGIEFGLAFQGDKSAEEHELRCRVREAGQRAFTAAAADLDALAGWTQESFAGDKATTGLDRITLLCQGAGDTNDASAWA